MYIERIAAWIWCIIYTFFFSSSLFDLFIYVFYTVYLFFDLILFSLIRKTNKNTLMKNT